MSNSIELQGAAEIDEDYRQNVEEKESHGDESYEDAELSTK